MLLIISEVIIIACCIIMLVLYKKKVWLKLIWMGSKAYTVENLIKINNNQLYPILKINQDGSTVNYSQNYASLLAHSGKECEKDYKKCGILDSLGNILCIPENETCPINDIKIDLASSASNNDLKGYESTSFKNLQEGYVLYYTNNATEKEIISKLSLSNEIPLYINLNNLIYDEQTYKDYLESLETDNSGNDRDYRDSGGSSGGGGGWDGGGSGGGGWRKLGEEKIQGGSYMKKYFENNMENENNIDKSFKKIYDNLWAGTYIGFKDKSQMNKFNKVDLHETYFTIFPNKSVYILCYINIVCFAGLSVLSAFRFFHKDVENEEFKEAEANCSKLMVLIPYLAFFLGFFGYIIYAYVSIYINRNPGSLTYIKADPFLEDFLKEIKERHPAEEFIFSIMMCYCGSMIIFILAWILSYIFTKKYMGYMNKAGNAKKNRFLDD